MNKILIVKLYIHGVHNVSNVPNVAFHNLEYIPSEIYTVWLKGDVHPEVVP